jgi:hypothetical protein
VFAAKARTFSGHVPEHAEAAVRALTDLSTVDAAALADDVTRIGAAAGQPRYETWRSAIRDRMAVRAASPR